MGEIGWGYGSEWHLLRWLGRHRDRLNKRIMAEIGAESVRWVDFNFDEGKTHFDAELKGLEFLPEGSPARRAWARYWPQRGMQQNWDAVGIATIQGIEEWLLVEAKAHSDELSSDCGADERGGRPQIRQVLDDLKRACGAPDQADWLHGYYQFANRLAVLNFLNASGVPARLVLLYFCGDQRRDNYKDKCPASPEAWQPVLDEQARGLGLEHDYPLSARVHKLFLPVIDAS